jgi:hypothetical protein
LKAVNVLARREHQRTFGPHNIKTLKALFAEKAFAVICLRGSGVVCINSHMHLELADLIARQSGIIETKDLPWDDRRGYLEPRRDFGTDKNPGQSA